MTEPNAPPSLDELDARLRAARGGGNGGKAAAGGDEAPKNALGVAVRVGVELVAALMVGAGIGYLIDAWLGTKPWVMVAFFFLGAATGIVNVWRVLNGLSGAVGYRGDAGDKPTASRDS